MDAKEVRDKIKNVFMEVFTNLKEENFSFEKKAEDIKEWDSLSHMNLVSELEKTFSINLEIDEISEMDSVKKVMEIVEKKLGIK